MPHEAKAFPSGTAIADPRSYSAQARPIDTRVCVRTNQIVENIEASNSIGSETHRTINRA